METTAAARKISLCKVTAGLLFGGLLLVGVVFQTVGSAGAGVISARAATHLEHAFVAAGAAAHRLIALRDLGH